MRGESRGVFVPPHMRDGQIVVQLDANVPDGNDNVDDDDDEDDDDGEDDSTGVTRFK